MIHRVARRRAARGPACRSPRPASRWPGPPGGPAAIVSNATGTTPDGSDAERLRPLGQPRQVEQRHPRDDSVRGVQRVRDRLGAVGGRGPGNLGVGRQHPGEQLTADAAALVLAAARTASTGTRPAPAKPPRQRRRLARRPIRQAGRFGGDDEPLRVGRLEVREQSDDRVELGRDLGLGQAHDVLVDRRSARSPRRFRSRRSEPVDRSIRRPRGRARGDAHDATASSPRARSSSACMNASRSPSRTADVLPVSCPVRRSLTIWYGCRT